MSITQTKSAAPCAPLAYPTAVNLHGSKTPLVVSQQTTLQQQLLTNCEFGGQFVITDPLEASTLYKCINKTSLQEYICKVCGR